jgi:formylglycine-generating enzyme required for sulfatase activity
MRRPPTPGPAISIALDDAGAEVLALRHVPLGGQTVRIGSRGAADEQPVRKVRFEHDWYLGETAVTQAQWTAVMGAEHPVSSGQEFPGQPNHPVTNVSWEDAQEFCSALQPRVAAGWFARLPTESEWEASCRAGTRSEFWFGDGLEAAERAPGRSFGSATGSRPLSGRPGPSKPVRGERGRCGRRRIRHRPMPSAWSGCTAT